MSQLEQSGKSGFMDGGKIRQNLRVVCFWSVQRQMTEKGVLLYFF